VTFLAARLIRRLPEMIHGYADVIRARKGR
jgi:hypothetical protein